MHPAGVAARLRLETSDTREVHIAGGAVKTCPYVGPVGFEAEGRASFGGALVLGNEGLLGAVAMEDMDLIVIPRIRRVAPNPDHPHGPTVSVR